MIFLFVGMIASGISARVTLLSHRGGWFLEDQVGKSSGMVIFDLVGTVSGIAAFIISFLLFEWWLPLIALALGYWFVAPFVVTRSSYAFFYQCQFVTTLVALACSIAIVDLYFGIF
jgi:hypothetical protein